MKILSSILLVTALACSGNTETAVSDMYEDEATVAMKYANDGAYGVEHSLRAEVEEKIIRTARLEFETSDPDKTYDLIVAQLKNYQGFIQNDQADKTYSRVNRYLTVRVPSASFHDFIGGVSEGVQYFDHKDMSQDDVTEEFIDLEARLKAKRALEERYIQLLSQAKDVKEMLEVERELSKIREEIESREGRLNYLKDRVAMSTLNISFYKHMAQTGVTVSYGQKIKNAFVGGWEGISVFFIGVLYLWPLWVLMALGFYLLRKLILRRKKAVKN